jgi:hypothetical protein
MNYAQGYVRDSSGAAPGGTYAEFSGLITIQPAGWAVSFPARLYLPQ